MSPPAVYTIWVVRNGSYHLIGSELTRDGAIAFGNRVVSTRDFIIKKYAETADDPVVEPVAKPVEINPNPINDIKVRPIEEPPSVIDLFKDSY